MNRTLLLGVSGLIIFIAGTLLAEENTYVGSQACSECHEEEYNRFINFSKKARTYENIKKMQKKLTREEYQSCFECHTTGYGRKGGFISEEATPQLKDSGCESCHGPGALHAESGDPDQIVGAVSEETCIRCHDKDRIETFDHQPLMFSGAH